MVLRRRLGHEAAVLEAAEQAARVTGPGHVEPLAGDQGLRGREGTAD